MTSAANLPQHSVVATADTVFIKADHGDAFYNSYPWVCTDKGQRLRTDSAVATLIQSGDATVLRVGDGT